MDIYNYIPLCNALILLMNPLIEIVIHDLSSGTIFYINGNLSNRQVGDPSHLEPSKFEQDLHKIIYPKISFDGRLIKSISIPIEDKWLICVNADISLFDQMKNLSELILRCSSDSQPSSLFINDWQEKLHVAIHHFVKEKSWKFEELNHAQKKVLAKHLFESGAFSQKNAPDYVAQMIGLGRATIFKYLKEWRNQ
ncbi:MAG: PAS domain-containing protein [Gammaproteobacteria bacterium]